jgi:aspartyl protease
MKFAFAAAPIELLLSVSLAAFIPLLHGEAHCPGNIASLPFHLVQRYQIIVPVVINHTGPYEFLVDTGTRFTIVDPLLAAELHLKTQGPIGVDGVGFSTHASFAHLDSLEAGSHSIANHPVVVEDLKPLRSADRHFRGSIGGDFLRHFDVLMDYTHRMLCLDDTNVMQAAVKGSHIALVKPPQTPDEAPLTTLLIVPVHLSGFAGRRLLLALDSGTNAPVLFRHGVYLAPGLLKAGHSDGYSTDGVKREFSILTPQSMEIGSLNIRQVSFGAPVETEENALMSAEDGLLATVLFRRLFISYAGRFVVLDPSEGGDPWEGGP